MVIELTNYDAADYLDSPGTMAAYLNAAIEDSDGDAAAIAEALGIADVAERAGLGRQSLYKALSAYGNPTFATINRVAAGCWAAYFGGGDLKRGFRASIPSSCF